MPSIEEQHGYGVFASYSSDEFDSQVHKMYQKDPADVYQGERNVWLTSKSGYILRQLQSQYNGCCPFDVYEHECDIANQQLGQPLSHKESSRIIKSVFRYGNNDTIRRPSSIVKRKRSSPSDLALIGGNFQRSDEYNTRREHIESAFYNAITPFVDRGSDLHYVTLDEIVARTINFLQTQGVDITDDKPLRHSIGSHIRYHYKVRGVKRNISGQQKTVYYGLAFASNPRHCYNSKTGYAIFRYSNTTYRIKADSLQAAAHTFQIKYQNTVSSSRTLETVSSTCALGRRRTDSDRVLTASDWRLDVEERLKQTFYRRYGRTLTRLRE